METRTRIVQYHRSSEKMFTTLAVLALISTVLTLTNQWHLNDLLAGVLGGLSAIVSVRCTVRATMHRWSREAAAALPGPAVD